MTSMLDHIEFAFAIIGVLSVLYGAFSLGRVCPPTKIADYGEWRRSGENSDEHVADDEWASYPSTFAGGCTGRSALL